MSIRLDVTKHIGGFRLADFGPTGIRLAFRLLHIYGYMDLCLCELINVNEAAFVLITRNLKMNLLLNCTTY